MVVNTSRLEEGASAIHAQSLRIAQIGEELEKISGELDTGGGMDAIRLRVRRTSEKLERMPERQTSFPTCSSGFRTDMLAPSRT